MSKRTPVQWWAITKIAPQWYMRRALSPRHAAEIAIERGGTILLGTDRDAVRAVQRMERGGYRDRRGK